MESVKDRPKGNRVMSQGASQVLRSGTLRERAWKWLAASLMGKGQPESLRPGVRRFLLAGAELLLLIVAGETLSGGLHQLPRSVTFGQQVETAVQLACGVLSLLGVLTSFWWRRWGPPVLAAWAVSLSAAAGISSLVWGPPSLSVGLVFAAGSLLIAVAIIRLLRAGLAA